MTVYEHRRVPPLPRRQFVLRVAMHFGLATLLVAISLAIGMWGYEHYEGLAWRDAFLNTAMLLGGMGPVEAPRTDAGKLFAGAFALYAGLVFLIVAGLVLGPMVHRLLHRLHWDAEESDRSL